MNTTNATASRQWGLTLLRVSLGVMWISHAMLKYLVFTMAGTVQFFASVGLPGMLAYPVVVAEVLGGFALVTGFYSRQVALALLPIMFGAVWVHRSNGWAFSNSGGGWEYPLFLVVASLVLWLAGDGALAARRSNRFVLGA